MRPSILSRSVTAVAAIALGAAALAATPATAATPSGITRDAVLTATNGIRAAYASSDDPTPATNKALRFILNRACAVNSDDGEILYGANGMPTQAGASADGLAVYGEIVNLVDGTARECVAGLVVATTPGAGLSGTATLKVFPDNAVDVTLVGQLSGDVAATSTYSVPGSGHVDDVDFTASGASTLVTNIPAKTVKDKKTTSEKKAAKKKYEKKLKALKKSYAKALKKAGSSKSKQKAAKAAYSDKKKAAKAKYKYAIAGYKIVKKATTTKDAKPFTIALLTL